MGRTLLLLATASALAAAAAVASVRAPRPAPATGEPAPATLAALGADPLAHLGREVTFRFAVESFPETWNPFLTRFGRDDYIAVSAWADEQQLWLREEWENPAATLFARRGSIAERVIEGAPRYARFEATGRVRQVFLGRPWIEVERVQRLASELGEGTLLHASRAMQRMQAGQWTLAAQELERALAVDVPAHAREALDALRRDCLARAGP